MSFDLGLGRVVPPEVPLVVNHGWEAGAHAGLDIGIPVGTPLFAAADGKALHARVTSSDAGVFVDLIHDSGVISRYLHMSRLSIAEGDQVSKGQLIGLSGNTGLSSGPHLHFELRTPGGVALPLIKSVAGEPRGGWNNFLPSIGLGFPAEPWLPVDKYTPGAIANARSYGIPLYNEIPHDAGVKSGAFWTLAIGGGIGYGIWRWLKSRR